MHVRDEVSGPWLEADLNLKLQTSIYLFIYLFIHSSINPHQDNVTTKTQLETSKTTVWNKWLTQGNATYLQTKHYSTHTV